MRRHLEIKVEERRDIVARKRGETILVKLGQDANWIDSYREVVGAKDVLRETTGVRKTRAEHILIEINNKVSADEVAVKLKTAMKKDMEISTRETLEIKNIDPIATRKELTEDTELDIKEEIWIQVKSLRTQQAVVVVPANSIPSEKSTIRIRTELMIATARVIPNVLRCYRYHTLGHNEARCTVLSTGRQLCQRCGDRDHTINGCSKEPRCAFCTAERRANLIHVTGSLWRK